MGRDRRPISCGNCVQGARRAKLTRAPGLRCARLRCFDCAQGGIAKPSVARLASNRYPGIRCRDGLKKRQRVRSSYPSGSSKTATVSPAGKLCRSGSASLRETSCDESPQGISSLARLASPGQGGSHRYHFIHSGGMGAREGSGREVTSTLSSPLVVVAHASLKGGLTKMPLGCLTYSHW